MSPAQAQRLFARERARFAKHVAWVSRTRLSIVNRQCTARGHCRFRDLAFADVAQKTPRVTLLSRALRLPDMNIHGLILHELGHVADVDIDMPGREQRADDIAEWVTGIRINYDTRNIETTGPGRYPRPRSLHR